MLISRRYSNPDTTVITLLKIFGANVTEEEAVNELQKHPEYPSLLAISDILKWFGVENDAYHVEFKDLAEVPVPFIACVKPSNDFVTVKSITGKQVVLTDHRRSNYTLTLKEFETNYTGIILSPDQTDKVITSGQHWIDKFILYKPFIAILFLIISISLIIFYNLNDYKFITWQIAFVFIVKTAGLLVSLLLLVQSINKNNPLGQILCGSGSNKDCNAILTSKAATVVKGLSWSEVGFFIFRQPGLQYYLPVGTKEYCSH
jgi:ABC-type bacteriocin/lantibiotic exporter with double-glycine peptidase domain